MKTTALTLCRPEPGRPWTAEAMRAVAPCLERMDAAERVEWALQYLPSPPILTSSFGAQAAVMLHLMTRRVPDISVVFIDTGYLFTETYNFVETLRERLDLNLAVFSADMSPAWQEIRYGRLWEQGLAGIQQYNQLNKVEPMARALRTLRPGVWFSGLRRSQSTSRRRLGVIQAHDAIAKIHPIVDWSDRDVHGYLKDHDLPYHPLWDEGYVSIGDAHTSRPLSVNRSPEEARFFGLVRECGLHEPARYDRATANGG